MATFDPDKAEQLELQLSVALDQQSFKDAENKIKSLSTKINDVTGTSSLSIKFDEGAWSDFKNSFKNGLKAFTAFLTPLLALWRTLDKFSQQMASIAGNQLGNANPYVSDAYNRFVTSPTFGKYTTFDEVFGAKGNKFTAFSEDLNRTGYSLYRLGNDRKDTDEWAALTYLEQITGRNWKNEVVLSKKYGVGEKAQGHAEDVLTKLWEDFKKTQGAQRDEFVNAAVTLGWENMISIMQSFDSLGLDFGKYLHSFLNSSQVDTSGIAEQIKVDTRYGDTRTNAEKKREQQKMAVGASYIETGNQIAQFRVQKKWASEEEKFAKNRSVTPLKYNPDGFLSNANTAIFEQDTSLDYGTVGDAILGGFEEAKRHGDYISMLNALMTVQDGGLDKSLANAIANGITDDELVYELTHNQKEFDERIKNKWGNTRAGKAVRQKLTAQAKELFPDEADAKAKNSWFAEQLASAYLAAKPKEAARMRLQIATSIARGSNLSASGLPPNKDFPLVQWEDGNYGIAQYVETILGKAHGKTRGGFQSGFGEALQQVLDLASIVAQSFSDNPTETQKFVTDLSNALGTRIGITEDIVITVNQDGRVTDVKLQKDNGNGRVDTIMNTAME